MTDPAPIPVLQFVTSFHVGGTERHFLSLVEGLAATEFRSRIACFEDDGDLRDRLVAEHPVVELSLDSLLSARAVLRLAQLVRLLRRERIQIVHTTGLYPNLLGILAARLAGTPVRIASVRDMGSMWSPRLLRAQAAVCRLADAVVTNARAIARRLEDEGYDPAKIHVIPNGLPEPPATPSSGRGGLRRELGLPAGAPLVGTVCRLDRVKGLETLIDAAARLRRERSDVRFLVVGGPSKRPGGAEYQRELEQRIDDLGLSRHVLLVGQRDDVPRILSELSVAVLASRSEGLSNALLESMAAGLPVVATRVGGNPELVEHGTNGLLVPVDDPVALASALARLLADPARAAAMGRLGARRVRSRYSHERMVGDTADLYRRLLAARDRSGIGGRLAVPPRLGRSASR